MTTLHIPHESLIQMHAARVERMGLTDPIKPMPPSRRVVVKKPNRGYVRSPAEQKAWNAMVAAWRSEPSATVRAMRRRFGCSLTTIWKARREALTP